jgi:hypothetical protein
MIEFEVKTEPPIKPETLVRDRKGKLVFAYMIPVGMAAYTCKLAKPLGKRLK